MEETKTELSQFKVEGPRILVAVDPARITTPQGIMTNDSMNPLDDNISRGTVVKAGTVTGLELPKEGERIAFMTPMPGNSAMIGLDGEVFCLIEHFSIVGKLHPLTETEQEILFKSREGVKKKILDHKNKK